MCESVLGVRFMSKVRNRNEGYKARRLELLLPRYHHRTDKINCSNSTVLVPPEHIFPTTLNMQLSVLLLVTATSLVSAGQVNFYSDKNCQNYIGERHPASFTTTGYALFSPSPFCAASLASLPPGSNPHLMIPP